MIIATVIIILVILTVLAFFVYKRYKSQVTIFLKRLRGASQNIHYNAETVQDEMVTGANGSIVQNNLMQVANPQGTLEENSVTY